MKPTGADKVKRGRPKKKLELGGVLKFQSSGSFPIYDPLKKKWGKEPMWYP